MTKCIVAGCKNHDTQGTTYPVHGGVICAPCLSLISNGWLPGQIKPFGNTWMHRFIRDDGVEEKLLSAILELNNHQRYADASAIEMALNFIKRGKEIERLLKNDKS